MDTLHGWYSLNAYLQGDTEYIYMSEYNQLTYCTIITGNKEKPYTSNSPYNDVVYCGKIKLPLIERKYNVHVG